LSEKKDKILGSGDVDNFFVCPEVDIMDSRLKVAIRLEFFGKADYKILATCAVNEFLLDESDFLWQTEGGLIVVLDKMVVIFWDMRVSYFRKCTSWVLNGI
jgi:hypothetical protein